MKSRQEEIIQCIVEGKNEPVLKYLYQDPLRKVRSFVLNNSGSMADADDVFQDAVVAMFHYVKSGKFKVEYDLDGFLFKVAKNAWIDTARKRQKLSHAQIEVLEKGDGSNALAEIIQKEKLSTFHKLFDQLGDNCKKLLSYVLFEKKSMKEVQQLMGFKDDKVAKNQHYRCKKYFGEMLFKNKEALTILRA